MAKRLASLFAFLKPASSGTKHSDPMGLSLYADPGYWLYGLLSFCAKACESKTAEANGTPALRARDERGTPALEATGKTLALMQTVVMSFGRNQSLGKPDLPIHHLHVYFPVQLTMAKVRPTVHISWWVHTKGCAPQAPSLPFRTRLGWQVHMNMESLTATCDKWSLSSPPIKAPFELKYQCGQRYSKEC